MKTFFVTTNLPPLNAQYFEARCAAEGVNRSVKAQRCREREQVDEAINELGRPELQLMPQFGDYEEEL